MRARKWMTGGVAALALAAVVVSCGSTGGGGGSKGNTDEQFILNSNNSGRLVLNVSPNSVDANKSDRIGMVATLSDSQGHGISGVLVTFSSDIEDITFLPADGQAITDATGRADVIAIAGTTPTGTGAIVGTGAIFAQTPSGFGLQAQVPITLLDVGFIDADVLGVIPTSLDLVEPAPGQVLFFNIVGGTPPYRLENEVSGIGAAVIAEHCLAGCTENGDCNDGSPTPANVCKDSGQSIVYIIAADPPTGTHTFGVDDSAGGSVDVSVTVSFVCGNGVARGSEPCDLGDLHDATCEDLGLPAGTLSCNDDCTFNTEFCSCGNGTKDGPEQCDFTDFGDATCQTFGFPSGTLLCGADCTIDTSGCAGGGPTPTARVML